MKIDKLKVETNNETLLDIKTSVEKRRKLEILGLKILIKKVEEQADCLFVTKFENKTFVWDGNFPFRYDGIFARHYITLESIRNLLEDSQKTYGEDN